MTDFTPLYATNGAASIARFVAEYYPLALPLHCRMLNRGFNDTYQVTASDGKSYVFRLSHHRARGPADTKTETDFIVHLDRSGVPVATPVRTRDGALFVRGQSSEGGREGVLFNALDGRVPAADSMPDARANGATLAKVHKAAERHRASDPLYRLDLDHLLRRPLARVAEFQRMLGTGVPDELERLAERTAKQIESWPDLTWTHCHGDCHGFNARITAAGDAAFFDFDDGGPSYLAYDLAVFLWAKVIFGRKLHALWHPFVEGYRSIRSIERVDLEAVNAFVIVRHIWLMGEYASRAREWGSEPVQWIAREIDFLTMWERDRVADRLL